MATTGTRPIGAGRPNSRSALLSGKRTPRGSRRLPTTSALTAPRESLLEFFRNSPLAEAMGEGELGLERERDPTPNIIW